MKWLRRIWQRARHWWLGRRLFADKARLSEAQLAVNRVVMETRLPPDCASAGAVRGGCSIMVKHDDAWEAFVHNTYGEAATEAIDWVKLQGTEIEHRSTSKLNRLERRAFDSHRKKKQRARGALK